MQLLVAGKVDYAFTDGDSFLTATSKGKLDAVAVYVWLDTPTTDLASPAPIPNAKALSGKSVGTTTFSTISLLLPYLLQRNGVDPKTVAVRTADFSVLYTSFFQGEFDTVEIHAPGSWQAMLVQAKKLGKQLSLTRLSDWGLISYDKLLVVNRSFLKSSPDNVKRVVLALDKARSEAVDHATDEEIAAEMKVVMPQADSATVVADWHDYKSVIKHPGPVDPQVLAETADRLRETKIITGPLPPLDTLYQNQM
jgi:ABC-type nitrate/sulfonate/bicarbonate transport system substrate-binding protein